ncbi:MAG: efflux RND transporter periplasmic adaptor subunit [Haliea sp.]|uniref:efflux RND transporter periplasmic adaptor subunit n=1 Tax=Marinobacter salarius TaxID=1420917 RepID=UPI0032EB6D17
MTLPLLFSFAENSQAEAIVTIEKPIPVSTAHPVKRDIDYILSALGSVESPNSPTISAETAGRITRLDADVGTRVNAGRQLASIDNSLHKIQSAEAEAEFNRQSVQVENQQKEVARMEQLARTQSVSKNQLEDEKDQLRVTEAQQEVARKSWERARHLESLTLVFAPHDGSIARRHVALGDYVTPGQPLFDLVTVDRLRARLVFPEQDASIISIGQQVRLSSPAAPDNIALGQVTQINPRIQAANRAIEVLVEFDNPGG